MLPYAGDATAAPTGWLYCDGSAVSRATYATLFSVIGTHYGAGDGVTTFNLPDCRGRVLVALAPGGKADVAAIGNSDGLAENLRNITHHHTTGDVAAGTGAMSGDTSGTGVHSTSKVTSTTSTRPRLLVIGGQIIKA